MSDISEFLKFKREHSRATEWANLLGAPYHGGGGGIGALTMLKAEMKIYHQAYNGATNYHEPPELMRKAIERQISLRFKDIVSGALADLSKQREALAAKAQEEHASLMVEAGLIDAQ